MLPMLTHICIDTLTFTCIYIYIHIDMLAPTFICNIAPKYVLPGTE